MNTAVSSTGPAKLQRKTVDNWLLLFMKVSLRSIRGKNLEKQVTRRLENPGSAAAKCGSSKVAAPELDVATMSSCEHFHSAARRANQVIGPEPEAPQSQRAMVLDVARRSLLHAR
jgi:hypothetical protein